MKTSPQPRSIDLTPEDFASLRGRLEQRSLEDGDYAILLALLDTYESLDQAVNDKSLSIKRLLKMIFASGTEKTKKVLKDSEEAPETAGTIPPDGDKTKDEPPQQKKKRKGHGRNGFDAYTGAERIAVLHDELKPKDPCPVPVCTGTVYEMKTPAVFVRLVGQPPIGATVYELQRLRCNLCGEVFKATLPEDAGQEKYDETATATIGCFKYAFGFPFNRFGTMQGCYGIPLPPSTQWDIVDRGAVPLNCAFEELVRQAAQGEVVYSDDTPMKILELMKESDKADEETTNIPSRKGMYTTGIISTIDDRKIALFLTGRQHAGENLADVLGHREADLEPPIHMADAHPCNPPKGCDVFQANCNVHSRRNFVDQVSSFPGECRYVIEVLRDVYAHDAETKRQNLSKEERLTYHQKHSGPLMDELHTWLEAQFSEKRVEPNSGLGGAISYMLNHWKPLTLFLRKPGAPLDNNIAERALKMVIRHRKNALFYKTLNGAHVGDIYMSLCHTCMLNDENPFDYITELLRYHAEVHANPSEWMPWNYKETLRTFKGN